MHTPSVSERDSLAAATLKSFLQVHPGRTVFLEHEVKGLLAGADLPVPRGFYLTRDDAHRMLISTSHGLAYPLVAKVVSPVITSKSDVGGVVVGIREAGALGKAVERLAGIEGAEGVLVEEMASRGVEVIVGGVRDPQFGPVVMFGLGGVFVELYKDVVFGLAPLTTDEASRLIRRIRGFRLLQGFRGSGAVDLEALSGILVNASEMMATGLIEEIDLNPVALYPDRAVILDAKLKAFPS